MLLANNLSFERSGKCLFQKLDLSVPPQKIIQIRGRNGIGKTTLLRTLYGDIKVDDGIIKWSENANIGYYAQDHSAEFQNDNNVLDWMTQFKSEKDDIQAMRSVLGKMLFGKEDVKKSVKSLSGGEKGRMIFA